eukprot:GHRR01029070.1.p1 GENE.GHRR01029070.1~~GHRR01029070.1.p1  ORF type:complete len:159 (+),score=6.68 GHRR01029070.1:607-1083(+)
MKQDNLARCIGCLLPIICTSGLLRLVCILAATAGSIVCTSQLLLDTQTLSVPQYSGGCSDHLSSTRALLVHALSGLYANGLEQHGWSIAGLGHFRVHAVDWNFSVSAAGYKITMAVVYVYRVCLRDVLTLRDHASVTQLLPCVLLRRCCTEYLLMAMR